MINALSAMMTLLYSPTILLIYASLMLDAWMHTAVGALKLLLLANALSVKQDI
jgi:hypothetical protein